MPLLFPEGLGGVCHPLNVGGFNLAHPECAALHLERDGALQPGWEDLVGLHARLAAEVWNCSSVQACALGQIFLRAGAYVIPGYWGMRQPPVGRRADKWRNRLYSRMCLRARAAQWLELKATLHERGAALRAASALRLRGPPLPRAVTLGIHADPASAVGPWRGQLAMWRAYAEAHGLHWLLDTETYFTGMVFARYMGLFWASTDGARDGFWRRYNFLAPPYPGAEYPATTFSEGSIQNADVLTSLVVFGQPPGYWDSLEALWAAVPKNQWTVWMDYDLTLSPCCFDEFSLVELIGKRPSGKRPSVELPHVILRESPREDYSHHCANAGFLVVRNSAVGLLFVELARRKRPWPAIPYGYQGALAESLLELLGMEWAVLGSPAERQRGGRISGTMGYDSRCLPEVVLGNPEGDVSYANFCQCYKAELERLAGPAGARTSRWVKFLDARPGPEMGLLLASLFLYRGGGGPEHDGRPSARGVGFLPLTAWGRDQHRAYVDAWLPSDHELGGPCALMPLVIHWASLPWRPRLIYDFLSARSTRYPAVATWRRHGLTRSRGSSRRACCSSRR